MSVTSVTFTVNSSVVGLRVLAEVATKALDAEDKFCTIAGNERSSKLPVSDVSTESVPKVFDGVIVGVDEALCTALGGVFGIDAGRGLVGVDGADWWRTRRALADNVGTDFLSSPLKCPIAKGTCCATFDGGASNSSMREPVPVATVFESVRFSTSGQSEFRW